MNQIQLPTGRREGDSILFESEKAAQEAFAGAAINGTKAFRLGTKAAAPEVVAQLAKQYPQIDFEKGITFPCVAASTKIDSDRERFDRSILELYAKQAMEKPVPAIWQHDRNISGLGRLIGTSVGPKDDEPNVLALKGYLWIPIEARVPNQGERRMVPAVEDGSIIDLSVGFMAWGEYEEVTIDGQKEFIYTFKVDPANPRSMNARLLEISFVTIGAQPGASISKHLKTFQITKTQPILTMNKSIKIELDGKEHALAVKVEGEAVTFTGDAELTAAVKSFQDAATAKVAELQKQLETIRAPFIADIVNAKVPGLDEATVKSFTAEKLLETAKQVTKQPEAKPEITFKNVGY